MNGAEALVHTLIKSGIDTVFANPGTSEMHFVAALDRIPGLRCVLCLDEAVVTGAADAYYRITGKPAATLMHCGPGLANGLSNLHNARRAQSGVVNIVGDQATYHRPLDAPLTADVEGLSGPVSAFTRRAISSYDVGPSAAATIEAARVWPGQVATLILPADTAWDEGGVVAEAAAPAPGKPVSTRALETAAAMLTNGLPTLLLVGGSSLDESPLLEAWRITQHTGARLLAERSIARIARGRGRVPAERIPYPIDDGIKAFVGVKQIVLVNTGEPVSFFAYPDKPGRLYPTACQVHVLAGPEEDGPAALAALREHLGAPALAAPEAAQRPAPATGAVTPERFAQSLAAALPDNAIVIDEAVSFGRGFFANTHAAAPHDWLMLTGGAIGHGLPATVGAAIAAPGRRVVGLQADGSAMYSLSALWTQARERLDVTTIIFSNRKYAILLGELANVGANPGRTALDMMDLSNPALDWCQLAGGMGVPAARAASLDDLNTLLAASFKRPGPFLIELTI
ncbi:acetolactate synthase large subunit [Acidocella sp.]|jgi:acetolactate synthase-1/2/3 large subunit|uniref:acetolactate synthase large subunit n=1 Tax=Acidocella sp. TaxID=50710 RepID=UPI002F40D4D1